MKWVVVNVPDADTVHDGVVATVAGVIVQDPASLV